MKSARNESKFIEAALVRKLFAKFGPKWNPLATCSRTAVTIVAGVILAAPAAPAAVVMIAGVETVIVSIYLLPYFFTGNLKFCGSCVLSSDIGLLNVIIDQACAINCKPATGRE